MYCYDLFLREKSSELTRTRRQAERRWTPSQRVGAVGTEESRETENGEFIGPICWLGDRVSVRGTGVWGHHLHLREPQRGTGAPEHAVRHRVRGLGAERYARSQERAASAGCCAGRGPRTGDR